MNAAKYTINILSESGIGHVFGYQGGNISYMIDAVYQNPNIEYIQTYNEQSAAFAACAYAQVTENFGVTVSSSGPGAMNLMNGIANAYFDSIPCLFITGNVNSKTMKIKNIKLMLLGLVGLMGTSSAFATDSAFPVTAKDNLVSKDGVTYKVKADTDVKKDETGRSVNNVVYDLYTVTWTATTGTASFKTYEAYVQGVNSSAADADVATIAIPATVTGDLDVEGGYKVVGIADNWVTALKDVKATTTTLSIDITNLKTGTEGDDPVTIKTGQTLPDVLYKDFTKLQSLTITDSYTATADAPAKYTVFNGVFADGSKATLTTANFANSNIAELGENAFKGCTALTGFDFTKITKIGKSAFEGDYGFTTVTIPATVIAIGDDAFKGMYKAKTATDPAKGLTTLVINGAHNTYSGTTLSNSEIPAAFSGNTLLNSVTVGSTTAISIAAKAFDGCTGLEVIDLSGATALGGKIGETTGSLATNAFPTGCALTTVKLYGTKLTEETPAQNKICSIDLSKAKATLATLTFPAGYTSLAENQIRNFVALTAIDLSVTKVKSIPDGAFVINPDLGDAPKDDDGNTIAPVLASVKLNAETTSIGVNAFGGQSALATVEGLNQAKLTTIEKRAFMGTALTALDLSATKVTAIPLLAFGDMPNLASITLPATVDDISAQAFSHDAKVASINLEDTKITTLNTIFHNGVAGTYMSEDEDGDDYTETTGDDEVAIALTSLTLPETLTKIKDGALQLLDITEITIPESVTSIGAYALQGCIKLEKFTWNNAQSREIAVNAFRGDDKLKEVKMVTNNDDYTGLAITGIGPEGETAPDAIFKGNDKSVLKFIVNVEDYNMLVALGWTEANLKYCTLTTEGASEFEFKAAGKYGDYYYATYYNVDQATWFPADKFEVFGAVVEGSNVVMKPFTVEGGYYKVAKNNDVCVIRSKEQKAEYELKNANFNDISTAPTDNELEVAVADFTPSRLKYQYKFGVKGGVVAFYRVTSGTIKEGGVYIEASTAAARLNIVFEGEGDATAIEAIANEAENTGAIYNLNGVRVNKAQKGIYIQDGKKFVK